MPDHTPPTDQELDAIEARAGAATPGPWRRPLNTRYKHTVTAPLPDDERGSYLDGIDPVTGEREQCTVATIPIWSNGKHSRQRGGRDLEYIAAMHPEMAKTLVDEVRRLRARQLTASEYNAAWHAVEGAAGQEGADPGTVLHAVLDRLGIEWQTAAHPAAVPAAVAPDTLPAWLHRRFSGTAVTWDALDSDERAYWEHQAAAVRRAVARGGFKTTRPAVRPAVETGARPA